jgi:hypothetical protein
VTERLPYISVYEAVRLIVAMLPGGEPSAPTLTDEWIRGGYASVEPQGSKLVASYREAIELLAQASRSPNVRITGVSASRRDDGRREIRDEERGLRLEMRRALFATPFGGDPNSFPAFLDPLICAEDLISWINQRIHPPKGGSDKQKRLAVNSAIRQIGVAALIAMSQKDRELKIIKAVAKEHGGLSVSERFVRDRLSEARLGKPSA